MPPALSTTLSVADGAIMMSHAPSRAVACVRDKVGIDPFDRIADVRRDLGLQRSYPDARTLEDPVKAQWSVRKFTSGQKMVEIDR